MGAAATLARLPSGTGDLPATTSDPAAHVLFVDIEGWYRRTPNEVAVLSPFDLSLAGLPDSLPYRIGAWQGADREPDPGVREWFGNPPVVVERTYLRGTDEVVWVSAFGNRGDASFHLFEHTPETCYPLSGWQIAALAPRRIELGPRPLTANAGRAVDASGAELAFLYVYVWGDPARDPQRGVVSLRLSAPVLAGEPFAAADRRLVGDFLPELFHGSLSWTAF
jgi:hypothetical protein